MNRFKNVLLATIALSLVALAIGQYFTARVIAGAQESVYVANTRIQPVPVVQVTQWEYSVASCTGPNLNCASFTAAGLQGWELVTVSRGPAGGNTDLFTWDFVFKRPKL